MFFKPVLQDYHEAWRFALTFAATFLALIGIGSAFFLFISYQIFLLNELPIDRWTYFTQSLDATAIGMDVNLGLFLQLIGFVLALVVLAVMLQHLHQRSWRSLINAEQKIRWSKVGFAFGLWMLFSIVPELIHALLHPGEYTLQFRWQSFLPLLLIAIFILPLQTSFEELFFRGYLLQFLGLRWNSRLGALLATSVLFALMHFSNPEIEEFGRGLMMTYYLGTGLFLGILTLMDDSLELALGIHAATNFYAACFVTFEGSALVTPALWRTEVLHVEWMVFVFFAFAALFTFICSRKYTWSDWSGKLLGPVIERPKKF